MNNMDSINMQSSNPFKKWFNWILVVGIAFILVVSWRGGEMQPMKLITDADNMWTLIKEFFPPDFTHWQLYMEEILVTLYIAIWGTLLGVIFAIPLGLLSASNIAPRWVQQIVRRLMDALRSINEMVFAMIFVAAVGLGPFPGILALFLHTVGSLAKLFAEAVEAIDEGPVEGVRSTGSSKLQEIQYGVIPQVLPLWISYALYRFESNVRSATVVGMVGAGGIGVLLWESIRGFDFPATSAIILIIIVTVSLIDMLSQYLRKKFI